MIKRIANTRCAYAVANQQPFQGSNLRGVIEQGVYVVYSYQTPVLFYDEHSHDKKWICNSTSYSRTTSKQITQACRNLSWVHYVPEEFFNKRLQEAQEKQQYLTRRAS